MALRELSSFNYSSYFLYSILLYTTARTLLRHALQGQHLDLQMKVVPLTALSTQAAAPAQHPAVRQEQPDTIVHLYNHHWHSDAKQLCI